MYAGYYRQSTAASLVRPSADHHRGFLCYLRVSLVYGWMARVVSTLPSHAPHTGASFPVRFHGPRPSSRPENLPRRLQRLPVYSPGTRGHRVISYAPVTAVPSTSVHPMGRRVRVQAGEGLAWEIYRCLSVRAEDSNAFRRQVGRGDPGFLDEGTSLVLAGFAIPFTTCGGSAMMPQPAGWQTGRRAGWRVHPMFAWRVYPPSVCRACCPAAWRTRWASVWRACGRGSWAGNLQQNECFFFRSSSRSHRVQPARRRLPH